MQKASEPIPLFTGSVMVKAAAAAIAASTAFPPLSIILNPAWVAKG
jgi:hypothetical protein